MLTDFKRGQPKMESGVLGQVYAFSDQATVFVTQIQIHRFGIGKAHNRTGFAILPDVPFCPLSGKSRPFAPRSPEYPDPSSPIFNDPSSPDQIDPQEVLSFIQLYQFYKCYKEIFYKGSCTNGIWGTKMVGFPIL